MKTFLGEFTGKTVADATAKALETLQKKEEEVTIDVIERGKVTFLGIGAVKAVIKVYEEEKEGGMPEVNVVKHAVAQGEITKKITSEDSSESGDGERAVEFLKGLFDILSIKATPVLVKEGEKIEINVEAPNTHEVIGKRGILLDALQNLAGALANIGREEYKRVVVDCDGYRDKRDATLAHVAEKTAAKAVRQGRRISLEPMSAYERRIIHSTLANSTEVKTVSEGKEPRRRVVVIPNELKPYSGRREDRQGNGRGRYGAYNRNQYSGSFNREKREGFKKDGFNRDGFRKDGFNGERRERKPFRQYSEEEKRERSKVGGGTGMSGNGGSSYKKSSSVVFGTFLGNNLKDENKE